MADQYLEKLKKVLSERCDPEDKERLKEELKDFYEKNLLKSIWTRYEAVNNGTSLIKSGNKRNSLIAYVLGITSKKPEGPFQMDKRRVYARVGWPDVDMDFCYIRRKEIIEFWKNKYGEKNVANIGTFAVLHVKNAIRRVIKVLDPENTIEFDSNGKQIPNDGPNRNYQLEQEIISSLPEGPILMTDAGEKIESVEHAYNEFPMFKKYMDRYPEVYEAAKRVEGKIQSWGCLSKDTPILTEKGWVRIDQLDLSCKIGFIDKDSKIVYTSDYLSHKTGIKKLYKMYLENGDFIKVTDEHLIFTDKGCVLFEKIRKNPKEYKVISIKK